MGGGILALAGGWSLGIALGAVLQTPGLIAALAALASLCAAILTPSARVRLLALGLMALLLGQARAAVGAATGGPDPLADHAGEIVVRGRVIDAPVPRGRRAEVALEIEAISPTVTPRAFVPIEGVSPKVLLRAATIPASYGDLVEAPGQLARPRSRPGWPLAEILARRGIRWTLEAGYVRVLEGGGPGLLRTLGSARGYAEVTARTLLPEPHASLLAGMVFGARAGLPPELRADLITTGTSHLTAVSGANVALVVGSLMVVALRVIGRAPASLLAMVGVWLYALMVGAPPSALRAATMATIALAAQGLGRESDAIAALLTATALLLAWDPGLAFDLGFQLSVAATAGLILLSPAIEARLGRLPRIARGWISLAVAAQLATLPIVLGTFQRLSLISLPANVLAAPLVPPIMAVGALVAVLGRLPVLDVVLGWAGWGLTAALLFIIEWCAEAPGAIVALGRTPWWLPAVWYAMLAAWVAGGSADLKALGVRPATIWAALLSGVVVLTVGSLAAWAAADRPHQTVIALLDVEPAAAVIRAPDGRTALVLTGEPGPGVVASASGQLELWESSLDVVIGPGGLRTGVDLLSLGVPSISGPDAGSAPAGPAGAPLAPGAVVDLGGDVTVTVVDTRQASERPALDLVVQADGLAVLLPGPGAPSERWPAALPDVPLVARLPRSAVSWARSLPPQSWLLLIGDPGTARARGESPAPLLLAREYGTVELTVEGNAVSVRTERCAAGQDCQLQLPPATFGPLLTTAPE